MKRFFSLTVLVFFLVATQSIVIAQESDTQTAQETEVAVETPAEVAQEQPQPADAPKASFHART